MPHLRPKIRAFRLDPRAASALEFAIVGPALLIFGFLFLSFGIGLWDWNALQESAFEAARCSAIGSPLCASVPANCKSSAAICYAQSEAAARGVSITTQNVNYAPDATCAGQSGANGFSTISLAYSFSILTYQVPISATACFPNNPAS